MLVLSLLLAGCGPEEDPCAQAAEVEPTLKISEGAGPFRELADGDPLSSESGPQGGEHVWVSLRASGLDPGAYALVGDDREGPTATVLLVDDAGVEAGNGSVSRVPWEGDAEQAETRDIQVFLSYEWRRGEHDLVVDVDDACGTALSRTLRVDLR